MNIKKNVFYFVSPEGESKQEEIFGLLEQNIILYNIEITIDR